MNQSRKQKTFPTNTGNGKITSNSINVVYPKIFTNCNVLSLSRCSGKKKHIPLFLSDNPK